MIEMLLFVCWLIGLGLVLRRKITFLRIPVKPSILVLEIVSLVYYTWVALWRPDRLNLSSNIGNWYLPWNGVVSIVIAGVVLLIVTRNVLISLLAGAFSTLLWTPIALNISYYLVFGDSMRVVWIMHWIPLTCLFIMAVAYHSRFVKLEKVADKVLYISFVVYLGMNVLWFIFPWEISSEWFSVLLGRPSPVILYQKIIDVIPRSSGYIFWASVLLKIFVREKK